MPSLDTPPDKDEELVVPEQGVLSSWVWPLAVHMHECSVTTHKVIHMYVHTTASLCLR